MVLITSITFQRNCFIHGKGSGRVHGRLILYHNTTSTSFQAASRDHKRTTAKTYRHSSSQAPYQPIHCASITITYCWSSKRASFCSMNKWYSNVRHVGYCFTDVTEPIGWLLDQFKRIRIYTRNIREEHGNDNDWLIV